MSYKPEARGSSVEQWCRFKQYWYNWLSIILFKVQHIDCIIHIFLCMYQEEDSLPILMKQFLFYLSWDHLTHLHPEFLYVYKTCSIIFPKHHLSSFSVYCFLYSFLIYLISIGNHLGICILWYLFIFNWLWYFDLAKLSG